MSRSTTATIPRVVRRPLNRKFTASTYRKAKPYLLRDFEGRCAYSLQHYKRVGFTIMEVDHFNPNYRGPARNDYSNLFPATRHCNGAKRDIWPDARLRKLGVRFLDPSKEPDYEVHIFEDPISHELVGITPAGKYHIRCCDLNAPHLVLERAERAQLRCVLNGYRTTAKRPNPFMDRDQILKTAAMLKTVLETMIPEIAPPPQIPAKR